MVGRNPRPERWGSWSAQDFPNNTDFRSAAVTIFSTPPSVEHCHANSRTATTRSCVEVEQLRIRVEIESLRAEFKPVNSTATGRYFDSHPDPGDESAYDALEKAYNLAFSVSSPECLMRSGTRSVKTIANHTDSVISRKLSAYDQERAGSHGEMFHTEINYLESLRTSKNMWIKASLETKWHRAVDARRTNSPQPWREIALSANSSILERAESYAIMRAKRQKILLQLAEACRSKVIARSKTRHHSDNGYTRPAANTLKMQISPKRELEQHISTDADADEVLTVLKREDAHTLLCEFLAREIVSFAEGIAKDCQRTIQGGLGSLTSHQLRRDHQRALSDYDISTIRWGDQHRISFVERLVSHAGSGVENPFQHTCESVGTPWKSSLKRLEFSDWHNGARREPCTSLQGGSILTCDLERLYKSGLNAIILHRGDGVQGDVASFLRCLRSLLDFGCNHLVVTEPGRFHDWRQVLSGHGFLVESYVRSQHMSSTQCRGKGVSRVLLCPIDEAISNIAAITASAVHVCVLDIAYCTNDVQSHSDLWRTLLTIGCRQRLLLLTPNVIFDLRHLALFSYPAAITSRRRLMAWNCVVFNSRLVSSVVDALALCTISKGNDSTLRSNWFASIESKTLASAHGEERILGYVERDLAAMSQDSDDTEAAQVLYQPKVEVSTAPIRKSSPGIESGAWKEDRNGMTLPASNKRRFKAPRSRKRISRCGECLGCLADDCMKCGHCQDMKKYGGPGLRKQSCKRRKCLHPKTWGLARKKRRSKFVFAEVGDGEVEESSGVDDSDADFVDDVDNDEPITSSSEVSDDEPVPKTSTSPGISESDSNESSHSADDSFYLSQSEFTDDAEEVDTFSDVGSVSRNIRSRVMRCGKCRGCTSGDCMKCIHCQDMKKYGGPGLRKQSCKNRKCIAPKVVVLNQARERTDEEILANEDDAPIRYDDEHIASGSFEEVADVLLAHNRLDGLDVVQECSLVLRKFQFFHCGLCRRNFVSQKMLDRHVACCHEDSSDLDKLWEKVAEDSMVHPAHELCCLLASRRSINPSWSSPLVRAYAKLEGGDFEYFFLKTYAIIGRMSKSWTKFYNSRGISITRGLPGGDVDCHLGDDEMIASHHAIISWDCENGCYTIECLSYASPLSVNGRYVHYAGQPLPLRSRDLIQIGASTVYFLLPVGEDLSLPIAPSIPRGEMRAWVDTAVMKRRSHATQDEAISTEVRSWTSSR